MFDTEVTDLVIHEKSQDFIESNRVKDKVEYNGSVDAASAWIRLQLENKPKYSERIPLNSDQTFNITKDVTELPPNVARIVKSAHRMEMSEKGLYKLCEDVSFKNQEFKFSFIRDPQGKWVEYSVSKLILKIGDEVIWKSQGQSQWEKPKKIIRIEQDAKSGRKFAFFEGSKTGIPLEQLYY